MFCKNCGKEIDDKAFVCPHCGVKVESTVSVPVESVNQHSAIKTKKSLNIAANVCSIVLMGIMLISAIILLGSLSLIEQILNGEMVNGEIPAEYADLTEGALQLLKIVTIVLLVFCVACIVVSSLALAKGKGSKGLGFKIAVIAMLGVVAVLEFVGDGIVFGILCLVPIGLEIASICIKIKPEVTENTNTESL